MTRDKKNTAIGFLGLTLLLAGCSDDGTAGEDIGTAGTAGTSGSAGAAGTAGTTGAAGDGGSAGDSGNGGGGGSGGSGGSAGTGDNPFTVDPGLPDAVPWGPHFIGVQNALSGGEQRDVGFAVFWEPSEVWLEYIDGNCIGFGTLRDHTVGRDMGTLTITGGSGIASQNLTLNDTGYYYLDGGANAWAPGDSVSADVAGYNFGSAQIPRRLRSPELESSTFASRSADFEFKFNGTDATQVAATISGGDDVFGYMLVCIMDATSGTFRVPGTAWASFPAGADRVNFKLTPANLVQDGDTALVAAGEAIEVSLDLED